MKITEKMLKSYFRVAEKMNQDEGGAMSACAHAFHRTKKYAFFVEAKRLNEDGFLTDEARYTNLP